MNIQQLKEIIFQQKTELEKKDRGIERKSLAHIEKYLKLPHAVVITGVRRCGKSTILAQIMAKHMKDDYYYLNFEDERLIQFSAAEDFDILYQSFLELYGKHQTFFFDEIQNIKGWERFVSRMIDTGFKFFITGSNARLLSRELATHLTGRHMTVEIYPFSFREFLDFKKVRIKKNMEYLTEDRANVKNYLLKYIQDGGFPEYLKYGEKDVLSRLYSDIIFRDIIVRHGIREVKAFQEISGFLMSNISNRISYNRIKDVFDLGSTNTVKNFTEYLENSFLIFFVNQFSYSKGIQAASPKKVYCIDTGLRNIASFRFSEDTGRLVENVVFLELKRKGMEIYYWSGKGEVDFVIKEGLHVNELIQVCWNIYDGDKKNAELKGLIEAMDEFDLKTGLMITEDSDLEENIGDKKIKYIPLWKWLLDIF
ncbi:MAG: ATP-binding protein [Euryarchaeota archaeon]|nr:ATP-binding protein [Euryarchaeota archaeon]MBU4221321.1 ATP-binding protein [Euryarchaeota archaeon]MBU4454834.1 ATP-binding protein [Euryarchaeota archaeon]MCG2737207.1 ATP-binding protein [Candidatus Methanoperedenaceae archaeon]